ncbi:MAG: NfnB [Oscillospiraceae bacterium]|nr:NfnB [Oscillospiraceae bacterium]
MNETIKLLLERRAVRAYEKKPVSREDLELIVKCGQYAPSAMAIQPWHFTVVTDRAILDKIVAANKEIMKNAPEEFVRAMAADPDFDSFRGAPCAILISGQDDRPMTIADCANATDNMAIAAQSLGLNSCYIASYQVCLNAPGGETLKLELGIPEDYIPNFALCLGYGTEHPEPKPRKEGTVNYLG